MFYCLLSPNLPSQILCAMYYLLSTTCMTSTSPATCSENPICATILRVPQVFIVMQYFIVRLLVLILWFSNFCSFFILLSFILLFWLPLLSSVTPIILLTWVTFPIATPAPARWCGSFGTAGLPMHTSTISCAPFASCQVTISTATIQASRQRRAISAGPPWSWIAFGEKRLAGGSSGYSVKSFSSSLPFFRFLLFQNISERANCGILAVYLYFLPFLPWVDSIVLSISLSESSLPALLSLCSSLLRFSLSWGSRP